MIPHHLAHLAHHVAHLAQDVARFATHVAHNLLYQLTAHALLLDLVHCRSMKCMNFRAVSSVEASSQP